MPTKIILETKEFPSKKAAKDFFRSIRDKYPDHAVIEPEDEDHLRALVEHHPDSQQKRGVGISHFTVEHDSKFGTTRHFTIHRLDGTSTDFSFISAVDGQNDRKDAIRALRAAIEWQVVDFRDRAFSKHLVLICPITGAEMTRNNSHVDHRPPKTFANLVEQWLKEIGKTIEEIKVTADQDHLIGAELADSDILVSWRHFHWKHAELRMLSPEGNTQKPKSPLDRLIDSVPDLPPEKNLAPLLIIPLHP